MMLLGIDFNSAAKILKMKKSQLFTKRQKIFDTLGDTYRALTELLSLPHSTQHFTEGFRDSMRDHIRLETNWINLLPYMYTHFHRLFDQTVNGVVISELTRTTKT